MSLQETADLVIFTGEILNGKLSFFCAVCFAEYIKTNNTKMLENLWFQIKLAN